MMYKFSNNIVLIIGILLLSQIGLMKDTYALDKNSRAVVNRYFEDRFEISVPGLPTQYDDVIINIEDVKVEIGEDKIIIRELVPDQVYNNVKITFIDNIGRKYELEVNNVITSQPSKPNNKFVYSAYENGLGRKPDHSGFKYWFKRLSSNEISARSFINEMITSEEFNTTYKHPIDKISALYHTIVGRAPEEDGLAFWMGEYELLNKNYGEKESILTIADRMMFEEEFKTIVKNADFTY